MAIQTWKLKRISQQEEKALGLGTDAIILAQNGKQGIGPAKAGKKMSQQFLRGLRGGKRKTGNNKLTKYTIQGVSLGS